MTPEETERLRIVSDPNILVSAAVSPLGMPAAIVRAWSVGAFEMIVSGHLLRELANVLMRPKFRRYRTEAEVLQYVEGFRSAALVADPPIRRIVASDEKDDYLMALGQASRADYVVSGDRHLTELIDASPPVLNPRRFYELLVSRGLAAPR